MNFATMTIAFPKMAATTAVVEPWVAILLVVEIVCVLRIMDRFWLKETSVVLSIVPAESKPGTTCGRVSAGCFCFFWMLDIGKPFGICFLFLFVGRSSSCQQCARFLRRTPELSRQRPSRFQNGRIH